MFNGKSGGNPIVKKNTIFRKEIYRKELQGPLKEPLDRVLLPVDEQNMGSTPMNKQNAVFFAHNIGRVRKN
jgi:hypothetical protein